jgi:ribulose-5-phosphate 4-epimerase/fuculose-1-phosphate aldolase
MNIATKQSNLAGSTSADASELEVRRQLAACYRMFARRNMDDLIYTHLSARIPGREGRFLFIPFGMLFEEVTASNLMEVDIEGNDVADSGQAVNPAGWVVHRVVYEALPAAQSVMHLHTTYNGKIGYHDYDGPGLRPEEQKSFIADLGNRPMMFLRNHGTLTLGRSIVEAFTLMHYLERSCEIQIMAQAGGAELALPQEHIIETTVATAQGVGDRSFGDVGFRALLRKLDREDPSYRL